MTRPRSCLSIHILCCTLAVVGSQPARAAEQKARGEVSGEIVDKVEKDLRSELLSSVKRNPKLRGAWVVEFKVDRDKTTETVTGCTIEVMVDKDSAVAKQQRAEIDRIATGFLNDYPYRVSEIARLPVHGMLTKLQSQVELNPRLAGTEIAGAYFSDATQNPDGHWQMYLDLAGQVAKDDDRPIMTDMANKLLDEDSKGSSIRMKALADSLQVKRKKNSVEDANTAFNAGIQAFGGRKYDDAYRLLTAAAREAPDRIEIHYWRVVALIGGDREQEASTLLGNLIKQRRAVNNNKSSAMESVALKSLERVQGPIRQRMRQLEQDLLSRKKPVEPPR